MFKEKFLLFGSDISESYPEAMVMMESDNKTGMIAHRRTQMIVDEAPDKDAVYISFHKDSDPKFVAYATILISKRFKLLYIGHNFSFTQNGEMITHPIDAEDMPSGSDTIQ